MHDDDDVLSLEEDVDIKDVEEDDAIYLVLLKRRQCDRSAINNIKDLYERSQTRYD